MLAQQWVGRYNQMSQGLPSHQGRVRSFLFRGAQKYSLSNVIKVMPILLNVSVFLFLFGLILFLFTISRVLATMVTVCTGLFGLAYMALTILPTIHGFCPYFTPMSGVWWYLWHIPLSAVAYAHQWIVGPLRADSESLPCHLNEGKSLEQGTPIKESRVFGHAIQKHRQRVKDGLRQSVIQQALDAPLAADIKALTWLLQRPTMADKGNIQEFVDSIPGVTLFQLSCGRDPVDSREITIHAHLSNLLQSCIQGTTELEKDARRRRLLVCLDALHHIVEYSPIPNGVSPSDTDMALKHVWPNFKDVELVRGLWADNDPAVRVTSRSICTHLARHLLRRHPLEKSEQTWLHEIMGDPASETYPPDRVAIADHRNLMSFVYGVLSNCTYDFFNVKSITRFAESLAVLMNAGRSAALNRDIFEGELTSLIEQVENTDHRNRDEVVEKLRKMFRVFLSVGPQSNQLS